MSELKQWPQWVMRRGKLPLSPKTGRIARVNDPRDWTDAATAWQAAKLHRAGGIGFVFTRACGVVGIDLDACLTAGRLSPLAAQLVPMLDTYTEISPSGRGLHLLVGGTIPGPVKRQDVEIYGWGRYFTMTGNGYLTFGQQPIHERQPQLDALYVTLQPGLLAAAAETSPPPPAAAPSPLQAQLKRALSYLPTQMRYDQWLTVLMAVHSQLPGPEGVRLVEAWSPGTEGEVARKFKSFQPDGGIGLGSLFKLARSYGYKSPHVVAGDLRGVL
jgi:hypothetical protein